MGMDSYAACECGAEEQTVDPVVLQCQTHQPPHGLHGLSAGTNAFGMKEIYYIFGCNRSSSLTVNVARKAKHHK